MNNENTVKAGKVRMSKKRKCWCILILIISKLLNSYQVMSHIVASSHKMSPNTFFFPLFRSQHHGPQGPISTNNLALKIPTAENKRLDLESKTIALC